MVEDNKLPDQEDKTSDNHGGKRPGSGRPLGAKTKKNWKSMQEMAEKYQVKLPKNYKQQIRWMKKQIHNIKAQVEKEKKTYNYMFSECETEADRVRLIGSFINQIKTMEDK